MQDQLDYDRAGAPALPESVAASCVSLESSTFDGLQHDRSTRASSREELDAADSSAVQAAGAVLNPDAGASERQSGSSNSINRLSPGARAAAGESGRSPAHRDRIDQPAAPPELPKSSHAYEGTRRRSPQSNRPIESVQQAGTEQPNEVGPDGPSTPSTQQQQARHDGGGGRQNGAPPSSSPPHRSATSPSSGSGSRSSGPTQVQPVDEVRPGRWRSEPSSAGASPPGSPPAMGGTEEGQAGLGVPIRN